MCQHGSDKNRLEISQRGKRERNDRIWDSTVITTAIEFPVIHSFFWLVLSLNSVAEVCWSPEIHSGMVTSPSQDSDTFLSHTQGQFWVSTWSKCIFLDYRRKPEEPGRNRKGPWSIWTAEPRSFTVRFYDVRFQHERFHIQCEMLLLEKSSNMTDFFVCVDFCHASILFLCFFPFLGDFSHHLQSVFIWKDQIKCNIVNTEL